MIVVDSSVWIAHLRDAGTEPVRKLQAVIANQGPIVVADLVLMEVLMGARDERHAAGLARMLGLYPMMMLAGAEIAHAAARNFRQLRSIGITVRSTIAMLIGTFCILHGHTLLHDDRDFRPMERHLGLVTL